MIQVNKDAGRLFLIPCPMGSENNDAVIPADVQRITTELRYFAVENVKTTRRYLRKLDREFPIDQSTFFTLNKKVKIEELTKILGFLLAGNDVGILSEAGCPGVADPGAQLVSLAHEHGVLIVPQVGPSSILMTLMATGFNGQAFTFHGYLPKERKDRIRKIKDMEFRANQTEETQLFMDTPFRNMNVLDDLLNELGDMTQLCIASNITSPTERIRTQSVVDWRENAYDLNKIPALFAIGKKQ
jgi:16S rRNA (cytidine1402-2'-O)-methyltransferase